MCDPLCLCNSRLQHSPCAAVETRTAAPPVHSCFNCSLQRLGVSAHGVVSFLSFPKSGQDLVTDLSAHRAFVAWLKHPTFCWSWSHSRFVCRIQLLSWKELSRRIQSSARSTEYRATARAYESWCRPLLKTIITYSYCVCVCVCVNFSFLCLDFFCVCVDFFSFFHVLIFCHF